MKFKALIKLNMLIFMLALSAGLIFFACGFFGKLPKDITVNGVAVGGKSVQEATLLVRQKIEEELKSKTLTVRGPSQNYVFAFPEIGYKDDVRSVLKQAKKGGSYTASVNYYLNGASEITASICNDESSPVTEPYFIFNDEGEAFTYFEGNDGLKADRSKLLSDIRLSLNGGFEDVTVNVTKIARTTRMQDVKYNTRLLSTFTTYFDGENLDRVHNIRLAARQINGAILGNGEAFSFNKTVGERTAARGFKKAKIIENGEFVEGTGGGVCQVSTTLFNAALLAGCEITEYHAHSLAVSYVPPSFDAMVSGNYCDLKFVNCTGYTLYVRARTGRNYIRFDFYGRGDGAQYGYSSMVTGSIPAPEEFTDDAASVKEGRDGTYSEGYLTINKNGVSKTTLFRKDKYSPVKRITLETLVGEQQENPTEDNDNSQPKRED